MFSYFSHFYTAALEYIAWSSCIALDRLPYCQTILPAADWPILAHLTDILSYFQRVQGELCPVAHIHSGEAQSLASWPQYFVYESDHSPDIRPSVHGLGPDWWPIHPFWESGFVHTIWRDVGGVQASEIKRTEQQHEQWWGQTKAALGAVPCRVAVGLWSHDYLIVWQPALGVSHTVLWLC